MRPHNHHDRRPRPQAADLGSARGVLPFAARVAEAFCADENVAYLAGELRRLAPPGPARAFALRTLPAAARAYADGAGRDALDDPFAASQTQFWPAIRRLNRGFCDERAQFLAEYAPLLAGAGRRDDAEPYHMQAFEDDSLRPAGLESLNGPGPLAPDLRARGYGPAGEAPDDYDLGVADDDRAWGAGDPGRTAERAAAEYWGAGHEESAYDPGPPAEDDGPRMRYSGVPVWQTQGARRYELDISETLGAARDDTTHVRGWPTEY